MAFLDPDRKSNGLGFSVEGSLSSLALSARVVDGAGREAPEARCRSRCAIRDGLAGGAVFDLFDDKLGDARGV